VAGSLHPLLQRKRARAGCQRRLFFSQVEFCDNLVFRRRAAPDMLGERLLDANRTIGRPDKITVIFGRKIAKHYRGKLQTEIEDMNLPNPVVRSHYGNGFIKQYVRDHLMITLGSLPSCMRWCASRTSPPAIPSLRRNPPRRRRSARLRPEHYTLAPLRYDLSKIRAKGLVAKLPNSRRYQLIPQGYSICLVFLKLFERVYAPLTAGLLSPIKADARLQTERRSQLDRLYQRVVDDLDTLVRAVGLKAA
jgi:hypothetical protein